jgi:hypothetical protein
LFSLSNLCLFLDCLDFCFFFPSAVLSSICSLLLKSSRSSNRLLDKLRCVIRYFAGCGCEVMRWWQIKKLENVLFRYFDKKNCRFSLLNCCVVCRSRPIHRLTAYSKVLSSNLRLRYNFNKSSLKRLACGGLLSC